MSAVIAFAAQILLFAATLLAWFVILATAVACERFYRRVLQWVRIRQRRP